MKWVIIKLASTLSDTEIEYNTLQPFIHFWQASIAESQAKFGYFDAAFQTAKSIGDNTDRSDALASIAESQAESGEFDAPIGTSKSILVNRKDYLRHWHAVPTSAKYVSKTGVCCL